jgi:uncharacterized protein YkvS
MKREITKQNLIDFMDTLDTRFSKLEDNKVDLIIVDAFAEFSTVSKTISNRYIVDLNYYYENGEVKISLQIPEDVIYIYDLYLSKETEDLVLSEHGEYNFRDNSLIWRDPQKRDMFHINLVDQKFGQRYNLAYAEYVYIPTSANFENIYMHNDAYIAFKDALATTLYEYLHDDEKAALKRASMTQKAASIDNIYPEDYETPGKASIFPYGV